MSQLFDQDGNIVSVTVLEAGPCFITQVKTEEKDGYNAIQVGFGQAKKLNKAQKGHLKDLNVRTLKEIRLDNVEQYKVGQEIKVGVFEPGQYVDVSGLTIGKGFAGNVKRYHHGRGPMSHGSKSHRITGSIGAGTTPGRVFKGQRMPGRMGHVMAKVRNLQVVQIDADKNLILLNGSVPGKKGNLVMISKGR